MCLFSTRVLSLLKNFKFPVVLEFNNSGTFLVRHSFVTYWDMGACRITEGGYNEESAIRAREASHKRGRIFEVLHVGGTIVLDFYFE